MFFLVLLFLVWIGDIDEKELHQIVTEPSKVQSAEQVRYPAPLGWDEATWNEEVKLIDPRSPAGRR